MALQHSIIIDYQTSTATKIKAAITMMNQFQVIASYKYMHDKSSYSYKYIIHNMGCKVHNLGLRIDSDDGILTIDGQDDCHNQLCHQANINSHVSAMLLPPFLGFSRLH